MGLSTDYSLDPGAPLKAGGGRRVVGPDRLRLVDLGLGDGRLDLAGRGLGARAAALRGVAVAAVLAGRVHLGLDHGGRARGDGLDLELDDLVEALGAAGGEAGRRQERHQVGELRRGRDVVLQPRGAALAAGEPLLHETGLPIREARGVPSLIALEPLELLGLAPLELLELLRLVPPELLGPPDLLRLEVRPLAGLLLDDVRVQLGRPLGELAVLRHDARRLLLHDLDHAGLDRRLQDALLALRAEELGLEVVREDAAEARVDLDHDLARVVLLATEQVAEHAADGDQHDADATETDRAQPGLDALGHAVTDLVAVLVELAAAAAVLRELDVELAEVERGRVRIDQPQLLTLEVGRRDAVDLPVVDAAAAELAEDLVRVRQHLGTLRRAVLELVLHLARLIADDELHAALEGGGRDPVRTHLEHVARLVALPTELEEPVELAVELLLDGRAGRGGGRDEAHEPVGRARSGDRDTELGDLGHDVPPGACCSIVFEGYHAPSLTSARSCCLVSRE